MSESDPIDLSHLQNLQFRPSWVEDLAKAEGNAGGEVIWGRAPAGSGSGREERPRREGGRGFDRNDRGGRPGGPGGRGPRPDFRGGPPGQGDRRPPPRGDGHGPRRDGPPGAGPRGPRPERRDGPPGPRRDDRGGRPPFRGNDRRDGGRDSRDFREAPAPLPGWQVKLVPDHRSVEAIARQIKASGRAYSVFDVGRLFMDSRERYQVQFTRQPEAAPVPRKEKEGEAPAPVRPQPGPAEVYQCPADQSLWVTREEAIRHLLGSPALTKYYRAETIATEAPKGNFTAVAVCGFSGAILGPPNHHDFQRNVARLHRERFSDMSLERYKSRIRTEKDEALLLKWQESHSTATQYVPVTEEPLPEGTEPPAPLKSSAEMEAHFLRTHAPTAASPVTRARVPGNIPGKCLSPGLLSLLRTEVERQQRFPMQLVQDLCRDLESQGLRFFKRDKKATFVCRNRPHFLPDDLVLSERIRALVEMVRANPGITYTRLVSTLAPHITPGESPEMSTPGAAEVIAAAIASAPEPAAVTVPEPTPEAAVTEPAAAEVADAPPEAVVEAPAVAEEILEAPVEESAAEAPAAEVEVADAAPSPEQPVAEAPAPAAPAPAPVHLSPEEIAILQDLRWLVQEGYVTEFQSGELYVLGRPPQPVVAKKPRGPKPQNETTATSSEPAPESDVVAALASETPAPAEEIPAAEPETVIAAAESAPEVAVSPEAPELAQS